MGAGDGTGNGVKPEIGVGGGGGGGGGSEGRGGRGTGIWASATVATHKEAHASLIFIRWDADRRRLVSRAFLAIQMAGLAVRLVARTRDIIQVERSIKGLTAGYGVSNLEISRCTPP